MNLPRHHRKKRFAALAAFALVTTAATAADTEEARWWLHVGAARVTFHDHSALTLAGQPVSGAGAKASDSTTAALEVGYALTPHWSASATLGVPPTSRIDGTGTVASAGRFGEIKYGPLVLAMQYRWGAAGSIRPYAGAGAVYYRVLESRDGAIQGLDARSGWGSALQAGVEFPLGPRCGVFVDVKKIPRKTTATGTLPAAGGPPVRARSTLDPVVVHAGLHFSF